MRPNPVRVILATFTAMISLAATLPAAAATSSFVSASVPYRGNPESDAHHVRVEGAGQHATGTAEARASADFGVLKLRGETRLNFLAGNDNPLPNYTASAQAEARASEFFTITGADHGTAGRFTYGITILGGNHVAAGGAMPFYSFALASWEMRSHVGGVQQSIHQTVTRRSGADAEVSEGGFAGSSPYGTHYFTQAFRFGEAMGLDLHLTGTAYANATSWSDPGQFDAAFELGNSVYWGGISALTLEDGTPVTSFNAFGASGTDYAVSMAPVPEPATLLLWSAGFGLLVLARRRGSAR